MTTYTQGGQESATFVVPETILGGISFYLIGAAGAPGQGGIPGGNGGIVTGTLSVSSGDTVEFSVPNYYSGGGQSPGGVGGEQGGNGGTSTGVSVNSAMLAEAGGGGGGGGGNPFGFLGLGGSGGQPGSAGADGGVVGTGTNSGTGGGGANWATPGANGWGGGTPGSPPSGSTSGAGGSGGGAVGPGGGGGGGGYAGGGGGAGVSGGTAVGGGGGGGSSWADPSVSNVTYGVSGNTDNGTGAYQMSYVLADAPLDATLVTPAPNASESLDEAFAFAWLYNPGTDSGTQNAFAFRRKISGSASYEYWEVATASWSDTIVWNSSTSSSCLFPSGAWTNGNAYQWSVATQESHFDLQGPFANDQIVMATQGPSVVITSPSNGVVTSSSPFLSWQFTPVTEGDVQGWSRTVVYESSQVEAAGFVAGVSPATFDTGQLAGATPSAQVGGLIEGQSYVAFVQCFESGTTNVIGDWVQVAFTAEFPSPVTPQLEVELTTDPNSGVSIIESVVQTRDNLLSADDASFELSAGTWLAGPGASVAVSNAAALSGAACLEITAASAGTINAATANYSVTAGDVLAALLSIRAATTGRASSVSLIWLNAEGQAMSTAIASAPVQSTLTGWTGAVLLATAPPGAVACEVGVEIVDAAAGESQYLDCAGLYDVTELYGATQAAAWLASQDFPPGWSGGGYVSDSTSIEIQRSIDGGQTWTDIQVAQAPPAGLALAPPPQQVTAADYLAPMTVDLLYQARVWGQLYGQAVASPWSEAQSAGPITDRSFWIVHPTNPIVAFRCHIEEDPFPSAIDESQGVFKTLGRWSQVVVSDVIHSRTMSVTFLCTNEEEYQNLVNARAMQTTLLLKSPFEPNQWYFRFTGSAGVALQLVGTDVPMRSVKLALTEVAAP